MESFSFQKTLFEKITVFIAQEKNMSKKIFAINAGSSSLKFQLLSMPDESLLVKGIFEKIGLKEGIFKIEFEGQKEKELLAIPSHQFAVDYLLNFLLERKLIASLDEIDGVGHRVAHGGESFDDSALTGFNPGFTHAPVRFEVAVGETTRSEERRVGKECRSRWSPYP